MRARVQTLLGLLLCLAAGAASAAPRTLELREPLGVDWRQELVRLDFGDTAGCTAESLRLEGPGGALPAQLLEPGVVAAIVDFAAGASARYMLRCDGEGATPAADLRISEQGEQSELVTASFAARLRLGGERFARPRRAEGLPGPIAGLRFEDGPWVSGGALFGPGRVREWEGRWLARGPLLARAEWRYVFEGGATLTLRAELAAGDSALLLDTEVSGARDDSGFTLRIAAPGERLSLRHLSEGKSRFAAARGQPAGAWVDVPLDRLPPGELGRLTPWHDWWDDETQVVLRLRRPGRARELRIARRNAGAWVDPEAGRPGTRAKQLPLVRTRERAVELRVNAAAGRRSFSVGHAESLAEREYTQHPTDLLTLRQRVLATGDVGRELERVRGMTLAWPTNVTHPHLYLNAAELAAARARPQDAKREAERARRLGKEPLAHGWYTQSLGVGAWLRTGKDQVAREARLLERLREQLALLGGFDTLRSTGAVCALYDAVMASDLPSEEERARFRAQLAYLGYQMADPGTWSAERGYRTGNLNMTVAQEMQLGLVAATLGDHPQSLPWMQRAGRTLEQLLAEKVGPDGEWPESPAHYASVAASPLLAFAIASARNGGPDFLGDPRFERFMLWLAKQYTPPDPRHTEGEKAGRLGTLVPLGRGPAGEAFGLHGVYAKAIAGRNPALSAALQWLWQRTGQPRRFSEEMLGGWEHVVPDPALPAATPDWELDRFARSGAILRAALGSEREWWAYFANETTYTTPGESGTLPMVFARGVPISARFAASYPDREELLLSRVLLARNRGTPEQRQARYNHEAKQRELGEAVALPRQQYLAGRYTIDAPWKKSLAPPAPAAYGALRLLPEWPPVSREGRPGVRWRRQLLFVRPETPEGAGYLVLRDSVAGGQPTLWQWWSVSEALGTPEQAADRKRFLAEAPGERTTEARRLPPGPRYTAVGPFGVDVEFYVAEPRDTPRHTLRFGLEHAYANLRGFREYQDLLHLQRPDDGAYFVVVFPRDAQAEAPRFETLGRGRVVRVSGAFGDDWVFLSEKRARSEAGESRFVGTAASIQVRPDGTLLALGARGEVRHGALALTSEAPAELHVAPGALRISFPPGLRGASAHVTVPAPDSWRFAPGHYGATLRRRGEGFEVTAPQSRRSVYLERR